MSVYIKGMEMPTGCVKCLLNSDSKCLIMPSAGYDETNGSERRHDCPLVPVPEHGRLVDADALPYTRLYKDNWIKGTGREAPAVWKEDVDSAPTIIPADGKDTNVHTREEGEG